MKNKIYLSSFSAILEEGIYDDSGLKNWDKDQIGPQDIKREQVLNKPYLNFGKLSLADKLAFSAASLSLTKSDYVNKENMGICLGISTGSFSTDCRYIETVISGFPSPSIFSATLPSSSITDVAIYFGIKGPNRVCANGLDSGITAFELAINLIEFGKTDSVLILIVNSIESVDKNIPLILPEIPKNNFAFSFILTSKKPHISPAFAIELKIKKTNKLMHNDNAELYFKEFINSVLLKKDANIKGVWKTFESEIILKKEE
jgi:hypothetical protein